MSIEAGNYVGRAVPASFVVGETTNGAPQVGMSIEILNEGYEGVVVGWYGVLKGGATEITLKQLRAAGWTGESFGDPSGLGSAEVPVRVYYEEYQGEQKMKVSIGGGGGVRMDKPIVGGALAALDARLKGEILKSKKGGPAAPKPTGGWTPPKAAPAGDWDGQGADPNAPRDRIPF